MLFVALTFVLSGAILFQGIHPQLYQAWSPNRTKMWVSVNSLVSDRNPIPYMHYSLPFCRPDEVKVDRRPLRSEHENLGEVLWGDRIQNSPYYVLMREDVSCMYICKKTFTKREVRRAPRIISRIPYRDPQVKLAKRRVDREYRANMFLDGLPLASFPADGSIADWRPSRRTCSGTCEWTRQSN